MFEREKHFYEFGPFRLDAGERILLRDGKTVPLPPKAFETLLALVEHSGHVLDKNELIGSQNAQQGLLNDIRLSQRASHALRKKRAVSPRSTRTTSTRPSAVSSMRTAGTTCSATTLLP